MHACGVTRGMWQQAHAAGVASCSRPVLHATWSCACGVGVQCVGMCMLGWCMHMIHQQESGDRGRCCVGACLRPRAQERDTW